MTNRERRRYPRVPNNLGAYVTIADESFPAKARDVAPSGIRLECSDAIQERLIELLFSLPGDDTPVAADCAVNYLRSSAGGAHLLGLLFRDVSPIDEARLSRYFERNDPRKKIS